MRLSSLSIPVNLGYSRNYPIPAVTGPRVVVSSTAREEKTSKHKGWHVHDPACRLMFLPSSRAWPADASVRITGSRLSMAESKLEVQTEALGSVTGQQPRTALQVHSLAAGDRPRTILPVAYLHGCMAVRLTDT